MSKKKKETHSIEEPMVAYSSNATLTTTFSRYSPEEILRVAMSGSNITQIQKTTNLSAQTLGDALGVSKTKYYDLLQSGDLDFKTKDALVDLAYLWEKGIEAFDDNQDHLLEWLNATNENLGDIKPVSLFGSRIGRRELEKAFLRIEHSTYG